jgi:replication initiation protein RepC
LSFESRNVYKAVVAYLRALSAMARAKDFSIGPMLMALLRGKLAKSARERKSTE